MRTGRVQKNREIAQQNTKNKVIDGDTQGEGKGQDDLQMEPSNIKNLLFPGN